MRKKLRKRDLFVFDGNPFGEYIFCSCVFGNSYKSYYYLTDDETLEEGDLVKVPVGNNGRMGIAEIVEIEYYNEDEVPMSLEKVKKIIGRA